MGWSGTTLATLGEPDSIFDKFYRFLGGLEEFIGKHFGGSWLTFSRLLCSKCEQIPRAASLVSLEGSVTLKGIVLLK